MFHRYGDIFTTGARVIGHGVNTKGLMGSGIAVQFREKYPEMFEVYKEQCENGSLLPGDVFAWRDDSVDIPLVLNIASQEFPGCNATLEYLESGLNLAAVYICENTQYDILALPEIGCGIGGLYLPDVIEIIHSVEDEFGIAVELWTYQE